MSDKIIAIISTGEAGKARTGVMYAINALKHGWLEEVKLIFFGPAEQLMLEDTEIQSMLKEYQHMEETAVACKFIADRDGVSQQIDTLGVKVEFVGKLISDYVKQGYVPFVW